MSKDERFDVIIVGGGPAGLTAGIYAARARRRTVLLEKHGTGGQMALTWEVENYPGYADGVMGPAMMQDFRRQAERFGGDVRVVTESILWATVLSFFTVSVVLGLLG